MIPVEYDLPIRSAIRRLQVDQELHDKTNHPDIWSMPAPQRITHVTLHLCKYAGRLYRSRDSSQLTVFMHTVADSVIMIHSGANALRLDLSQALMFRAELKTLQDLSNADQTTDHLLQMFVEYTSDLASACEKMDHLEPGDRPGEIRKALISLWMLAMPRLVAAGYVSLIPSRQAQAKSKIFWNQPVTQAI